MVFAILVVFLFIALIRENNHKRKQWISLKKDIQRVKSNKMNTQKSSKIKEYKSILLLRSLFY